MEVYEMLELGPCPNCGGVGYLEDEGSDGVYVTCNDCGAQTVVLPYKTPEDKLQAAKRVEGLWNSGKAVSSERGE